MVIPLPKAPGFIGLAEVVGAWLLLWSRTKLLGVAILLPIMLNILVFDVVFLDAYGALASATIYTLLLFMILAYNREAVVRAIRALMPPGEATSTSRRRRTQIALAALVLMALLFAADQALINFLGHGRG